MSFKPLRFALIATIALLALVITMGVYLLRPCNRARSLIVRVSAIEVGKSTFDEARRLAIQIRATPSDPCTPAGCTWSVRVDNSAIPVQWRGLGTIFSTQFQVSDSVVSERAFSFQIGTGPNISFAEVDERVHWRGNTTEPVFVSTQTAIGDPYYRAFVRLTPAAPPEIRKRYLSFNLSCLWKYGGCQNARDLLPTVVWK